MLRIFLQAGILKNLGENSLFRNVTEAIKYIEAEQQLPPQ